MSFCSFPSFSCFLFCVSPSSCLLRVFSAGADGASSTSSTAPSRFTSKSPMLALEYLARTAQPGPKRAWNWQGNWEGLPVRSDCSSVLSQVGRSSGGRPPRESLFSSLKTTNELFRGVTEIGFLRLGVLGQPFQGLQYRRGRAKRLLPAGCLGWRGAGQVLN
ncbi:hypothetical protein GGR56DRAFT_645453 [Xylariaceae sp. FL0804]|nr:hypothetical protein GGR56DRAFT_645453 [Xylariaceae sp. FL0804]